MSEQKTKILFTATFYSSFINNDLQLLQKYFDITSIFTSGWMTLFHYWKQIKNIDVTFSWFASVYSSILVWLTKQYHKKSVIILGGVDVAKIPKYKYGIWNSWWKSRIVRYGITHADIVIAVDESLKNDAMQLAQYDGANIQVIPTGYDPKLWVPNYNKENFVLTVAQCCNKARFHIKGINFFLSTAAILSNIKFVIVGLHRSLIQNIVLPKNVISYPFMHQAELLKFYQRAKIYFQPSMREGLPNSLCEAMLCECFPIGTNVGGIPTAIGNTGILVTHNGIQEAVNAIQSGMLVERCPQARERIVTHFSLAKREANLIAAITSK